ncbi:phospholipid methyltransferase [Piedraia hortae CBS 480.64]|uniref:Phosphatidyl-N-methylethanolamine N-methyltransferase n=1 Tax=Piedraia hortae CBS 480.64 TaxID=1314780 RepID=A0A6A7C606_9PEZI|nr:phospholipid methyltransferase [Piedraia hortae CBS 480.64]
MTLIDFTQPTLYFSASFIVFNPLFWNIVARSEYKQQILSRWFPKREWACYALAATIFTLGIARDAAYERALRSQPAHELLQGPVSNALAVALIACGNILVLTSFWALGITGTFLGDYFGILMDDMVTGFPFNVSSAPMYVGSTMSFVGTALWMGKPAGLALSCLVWCVYKVALAYEDPFTAEIYRKRNQEKKTH